MEKSYFNYTGKDGKGKVIAEPTSEVLWDFCQQESEFAQAIEQSHKSFNECIDSVAHTLAQSCSDLEVYTKAVKFYFSEATISMSMTINMSGEVESSQKISYSKPEILEVPPAPEPEAVPEPAVPKKITLDLDSLLDF